MANISFTGREDKRMDERTTNATSFLAFCHAQAALTYVSGGCVFVGVLVELPGSHGVHLDEGDAATAPLRVRLVDREEGLEEQIHNAFRNRVGVDGQTGQQVVHVAHVPELENGTQETSFYTWH